MAFAVFFTQQAQADTATTTQSYTPDTQTISDITLDPQNSDGVEAKVRAAFADIPVLIKIAKCESSFRQYDSSGNPLYGGSGGMVGVFQVAAAIHQDVAKDLQYDINTLDGNLAYARYLYEHEGVVPWLASASCWDPASVASMLKMGSSGPQVKALQIKLNHLGYFVAKKGEGSRGHESALFGPMTKEAVKRFQCDARIACSGSEKTNGYGMVGAKTRLALQSADLKTAEANNTANLSKK